MEGYQNQILQENSQHEKISASSYLCRKSSTRWTPTTEQIKVLKELYYINGVRSPTADQIQAICSRLRRYGKIEGKNVFYWFQNHKARERQKKRLFPNTNTNNTTTTTNPSLHFQNTHNNNIITENNENINYWKQDENIIYPCINSNTNNTGISCSSSSVGVVSGGAQFMGSFGYGAVNMENKLRDCSISGVLNGSGNVNSTSQWTSRGGYATYSNFHDKVQTFDAQDHDQDPYVGMPKKETLPLFPMHDKDAYNNNNDHFNCEHHFPSTGFYTVGYHWSNGAGANGVASLELSLNSCGYGCYSHNY